MNSLLPNRLTNMERQCWANAQYSRRECLDVVGIRSEVGADVLEEKVLNIFGKLGCDTLQSELKPVIELAKNVQQ